MATRSDEQDVNVEYFQVLEDGESSAYLWRIASDGDELSGGSFTESPSGNSD